MSHRVRKLNDNVVNVYCKYLPSTIRPFSTMKSCYDFYYYKTKINLFKKFKQQLEIDRLEKDKVKGVQDEYFEMEGNGLIKSYNFV